MVGEILSRAAEDFSSVSGVEASPTVGHFEPHEAKAMGTTKINISDSHRRGLSPASDT